MGETTRYALETLSPHVYAQISEIYAPFVSLTRVGSLHLFDRLALLYYALFCSALLFFACALISCPSMLSMYDLICLIDLQEGALFGFRYACCV